MENEVEEGQLIAGKYRIERVLGRGGMGVVMAAMHEHLNQRVALKFLTDNAYQQPEAVQRFVREARSAVQIQSEHVARVMDVGTLDSGAPFMVMEYLRGRDLKEVSSRRGPLPVSEAVDFVLQACDAVAEAHSLGIVHRDLKPSNLFLTERPDGSPLVKVLDFGISKAIQKGDTSQMHMTATSAIMGSPQYMSPEQIRSSKNVDARADVWALGTILHELLAGTPAYVADTVPGLLAMIVADSPPPLRSVRPDAPADLEASITRCLQKDREQRFANVSEFARSLERFASSETKPLIRRIARLLGDDVAPPTEVAPSVRSGNQTREPVGQTNGTWARTGKLELEAEAVAPPFYQKQSAQIGAGVGALGLVAVLWLGFSGSPSGDEESYETAPASSAAAPRAEAAPAAPPPVVAPPRAAVPERTTAEVPPQPAPSVGLVRPIAEPPKTEAPEPQAPEREADRTVVAKEDDVPASSPPKTRKTSSAARPAKARTTSNARPAPSRPRTEAAAPSPPAPPPSTPKKSNTLDLFDDTK